MTTETDNRIIDWDVPMRERFRVVLQNAINDKQKMFWFENNEFLTSYAKYLLVYLDQALGGEHHAA